MSEHRTIGQILVSLGRITEEEVGRAVAYQREHGGLLGEALIASGCVTREELEWGLASQFDLPYVFPEAETIDPAAAALVSPEWALAHLALPILRTDRTVTLVVESPLETTSVEDLRARTGLDVELALASGPKIRELIRQVYARGAAADSETPQVLVHLDDAIDEALQASSGRFGISVRGRRVTAWWDDGGTIRRRRVDGDWESALRRLVSGDPADETRGLARARWEAEVVRDGTVAPVEVQYLSDESGQEYLFTPRRGYAPRRERFPLPADGILSEIRLLARSGAARFLVVVRPESFGHELLPHLPRLLLDPSWRSIYITDRDQAATEEAFSLTMPHDPRSWPGELETLRAFHFDVVTVDLSGDRSDWTSGVLDVAAVAFLLWPAGEVTGPAYEAGIRWVIGIEGDAEDGLDWSLGPLHR